MSDTTGKESYTGNSGAKRQICQTGETGNTGQISETFPGQGVNKGNSGAKREICQTGDNSVTLPNQDVYIGNSGVTRQICQTGDTSITLPNQVGQTIRVVNDQRRLLTTYTGNSGIKTQIGRTGNTSWTSGTASNQDIRQTDQVIQARQVGQTIQVIDGQKRILSSCTRQISEKRTRVDDKPVV